MATNQIPKLATHAIYLALVAQHNATRDALVGSAVHATVTPAGPVGDLGAPVGEALAVAAPDAEDEASAVLLVNDIRRVADVHYADTNAHATAVTTPIATETATNEATAITLANAIRTSYLAHRSAAGVHYNDDSGNAISAAAATDSASLYTLLNEIKADVSAHILLALAGAHIELV